MTAATLTNPGRRLLSHYRQRPQAAASLIADRLGPVATVLVSTLLRALAETFDEETI